MREVDRLMIDEFQISLLQMMENAGRNLSELVRDRFLAGDSIGQRILVLAGSGGNGGGGLAAVRHLHNGGAATSVVLASSEEDLTDAAAAQMRAVRAIGIPVRQHQGRSLPECNLIIDAMPGYGVVGNPKGAAASLIRLANDHPSPTLANDIPSGIDATSGEVGAPAIHAAATLTVALPKVGLRSKEARPLVGELYVGDISVPPELYAEGLPHIGPVAPFSMAKVLRVW